MENDAEGAPCRAGVEVRLRIPGMRPGRALDALSTKIVSLIERELPHTTNRVMAHIPATLTPEQREHLPSGLQVLDEVQECPDLDEILVYNAVAVIGAPQIVTLERLLLIMETEGLMASWSMSSCATEEDRVWKAEQALCRIVSRYGADVRLSTREVLRELELFGIFPD